MAAMTNMFPGKEIIIDYSHFITAANWFKFKVALLNLLDYAIQGFGGFSYLKVLLNPPLHNV